MTSETLAKYTKAIVDLLGLADGTRLIDITASAFTKDYKVSAHFFRACKELGIIEVKNIARNRNKTYAILTPAEIDPKHGKLVKDLCNKIASSYTKSAKKKTMSIVDDIRKVLKFIKANDMTTNKEIKIYRHKLNHADTFLTVDEALERGLFLQDYEKHITIDSPREKAIHMITGGKTISDIALQSMKELIEESIILKKKAPKHGDKIVHKVEKPKGKLNKEEFKKELSKFGQRVYQAAYAKKEEAERLARHARVMLYIDNDIVPKNTFKDHALYTEELLKKAEA